MIKLVKVLALLLIINSAVSNAQAMVELKKETNTAKEELKVTAFLDYPPFGDYANPPYRESFTSIFQPFVAEYAAKYNFEVSYVISKNYATLVRDVRRGEIDLLLGMYHETNVYKGLEYIFPAAINNPIIAIMLPQRIGEVKTKSDLLKLRGGMSTHEHFSDYVNKELKEYKIKKFKTSEELYEKLFLGEIDYILGSQYYSLIEASRIGIRKKVSFSKQSLWNMPLFLGVSKMSIHKKLLTQTLTTAMENAETREKIQNVLIDTINKIEKDNVGVVPPSYSKK